ncbi:reelin domain-containing protein 1 [Pelobates fuscus]|uniref:reelin domain-containing protein 1 n=1 Tax=Pelobates fuscus TaxID=191477 RepID=UPI002FE45C8C
MFPVVEHRRKTWILVIIFTSISLCLVSYSTAFSHGASLAACTDMRPKHIRAAPQSIRKNYITIHTNRSFYLPGDRVPVTVRSARDFMGFLLQARRVSDDHIAGSFVFIPPGSKLLSCFEDGDTVTHSDKSLKRNLSFVWKAPDQPVGDIKFFVSIVQSYFVYWARIESSILLEQVPNRTTEIHKPEVSTISISTVSGLVPTNSTASALDPPYFTLKPPDILHPFTSGLRNDILANTETHTKHTKHQTKPSTQSLRRSKFIIEPSLLPHIPRISQSRSTNKSILVRTLNTSESSRNTLCLSCKEKNKDFSTGFTTSPPTPSSSPDLYSWPTMLLLANSEIQKNPTIISLEGTQESIFSPSPRLDIKHDVTEEISANFLHHSEDIASDNNVVIKALGTSPWVTNSIKEAVAPGKEGGNKNKGIQLAITQLGILLGCSAVLGMAMAAVLRCIHAQYCHKRTEVSFSEPENSVITLSENGEMMHFKKIRENSFVLVQAEYNWIAPAAKGQ